jgi:predicted transcriptional regulator
MRGTAVRVLDERYLEFIEALRNLGELSSITRLIADLSRAGGEPCEDAGGGSIRPEMNKTIHAFWMRGWIEVREITRKSKYGPKKNYRLKVSLDKISGHFEQERMRRSRAILTGDAFRLLEAAVTA